MADKKAKYWVVKKDVCPECQGVGVVYNGWFWDELDRRLGESTDLAKKGYQWATEELAREFGLDEPPPEEETCTKCSGDGMIEVRVLLEEALMDPEIAKVIAGAVSRARERAQLELEAAEARAEAERRGYL